MRGRRFRDSRKLTALRARCSLAKSQREKTTSPLYLWEAFFSRLSRNVKLVCLSTRPFARCLVFHICKSSQRPHASSMVLAASLRAPCACWARTHTVRGSFFLRRIVNHSRFDGQQPARRRRTPPMSQPRTLGVSDRNPDAMRCSTRRSAVLTHLAWSRWITARALSPGSKPAFGRPDAALTLGRGAQGAAKKGRSSVDRTAPRSPFGLPILRLRAPAGRQAHARPSFTPHIGQSDTPREGFFCDSF